MIGGFNISYNAKIKTYPDGTQQIILYSWQIKPHVIDLPYWETQECTCEKFTCTCLYDISLNQHKPKKETSEHQKQNRSLRRTLDKLSDLSMSNEFQYFVTLTFSTEFERYEYEKVAHYFKMFTKTLKRKYTDVKYIFVHEFHEDGAFHLHGLMSAEGFEKELIKAKNNKKDSKYYGQDLKKNGLQIYNIKDSYSWGYATVTKIKDTKKASSYIMKYLTKQKRKQENYLKNKKKYWTSKNLLNPDIQTRNISDEDIYKLSLLDNITYQHEKQIDYKYINEKGEEITENKQIKYIFRKMD